MGSGDSFTGSGVMMAGMNRRNFFATFGAAFVGMFAARKIRHWDSGLTLDELIGSHPLEHEQEICAYTDVPRVRAMYDEMDCFLSTFPAGDQAPFFEGDRWDEIKLGDTVNLRMPVYFTPSDSFGLQEEFMPVTITPEIYAQRPIKLLHPDGSVSVHVMNEHHTDIVVDLSSPDRRRPSSFNGPSATTRATIL